MLYAKFDAEAIDLIQDFLSNSLKLDPIHIEPVLAYLKGKLNPIDAENKDFNFEIYRKNNYPDLQYSASESKVIGELTSLPKTDQKDALYMDVREFNRLLQKDHTHSLEPYQTEVSAGRWWSSLMGRSGSSTGQENQTEDPLRDMCCTM